MVSIAGCSFHPYRRFFLFFARTFVIRHSLHHLQVMRWKFFLLFAMFALLARCFCGLNAFFRTFPLFTLNWIRFAVCLLSVCMPFLLWFLFRFLILKWKTNLGNTLSSIDYVEVNCWVFTVRWEWSYLEAKDLYCGKSQGSSVNPFCALALWKCRVIITRQWHIKHSYINGDNF